ncbi:AHH domain-containing protein [Paraburkholderia bannensis]|uniref:AHH domain-containing protein n=1 Tax=Paraburkholderia bannensis TaxID=765414 RepID=UPI002AB6D946|nr:AHH domain-containing protein [Paraburkholderia bannensis]
MLKIWVTDLALTTVHHIALSNSKGVKMDALRTTRENLGIPINSSENGIWLPKDASSRLPGGIATAHSGEGVHGDTYKKYVFDNLNSVGSAGGFDSGLAKMQSDLAGGKFFATTR